MFRKLILFAAIALIFAACNNAATNESTDQANEQIEAPEVVMMTTVDFNTHPEDYVGKEVVIEGTALHVCREGGKRMFIAGEGEENRIQIKAGDEIPSFQVELEGSDVVVSGIVDELRIDEAYLTEWENELKAENAESALKIHKGEEGHEHSEGDPNAEFSQIANYRAQMAADSVDHISFFSIIANDYKEKK